MGGIFGGGGKKGGSTPAPDFTAAATTNQANPFGSANWNQGADGRWNLDTQFTGQNAATMNAIQGAMGKAAAYDPTQARQQAIDSNYGQQMSRLNPRLMQQQGQFSAGAANSGLEPGTEAYNNANLQLQQGQNDALTTAMANAIRQGNETQATQMEQMRQPFLQAQNMMGMLPKSDPNMPFRAANAQYEAAKDNTSAQQAGKSGLLSGLGGVAGSVFGGPLGGALGGSLFSGKGAPKDQNAGYDENLGGYNF